jgi:phage terminase large subunit-like protein
MTPTEVRILRSQLVLQQRQVEIVKQFYNARARHNLIFGGARSGKTLLFCSAMISRALAFPVSRHIILRLRTLHVRQSIWMDTLPKVLRMSYPEYKTIPHEADGFMEFPSSIVPKEDYAQLWIAGLDDKERVEKILGKECGTLYFNECSQIPYSSVLLALTRLAQLIPGMQNRAYYDLNPVLTGHWTNRLFIQHIDPESRERRKLPDPHNYAYAYMNPEDNAANLDPFYLESLRNMPSRQRKRFYEGTYSNEQEGQLWSYEIFELLRKDAIQPEDLEKLGVERIVVAVDPSGASGELDRKADEIGIVVCARTAAGRGLVLEDASGLYSPEQWGRITCNLFHKWSANRVIGETNFGGDMVRATIQMSDRNVPFKKITASRAKHIRAEPVSALYEQQRISHCGIFPVLEDELANFTTLGYMGSGSPNHGDALVWGLSELFEHEVTSGLVAYLKETQEKLDKGQATILRSEEIVDKHKSAPADSALAKIATSTMIKPVTSEDTTQCPQCGSHALSRVARTLRCNQCGTVLESNVIVGDRPSRSNLFK